MQIYIFRHAEKNQMDFSGGSYDPGLTQFGAKQATMIAQLVNDQSLLKPSLIFTSEKKRAIETFRPLAEQHQHTIRKHPGLNERMNSETSFQFRNRVDQFTLELMRNNTKNKVIYCCTHYDWIEEFLTLDIFNKDLGTYSNWAPSSYMFFEVQNNLWQFKEFKKVT